ncbi:DEAD/DEAH box helicase [Dietzia massiliensis]|uniref:DEAD/DEAH box helicase n=1 Tax=Dietzia massiliensis TaxID=2697499 RepID=UPI002811F1C5|nr:DEAD/DEAH box helicase [Dietzia massiliensis]
MSALVSGEPTPVQAAALADAVGGESLLAVAPTGSGKTLVFAIGVVHRLAGSPSLPGRPRAVVVAPTRELAEQSAEVLAEVGAGAGLRVASFVGGQPIKRDRRALVAPVDVAVGTPGRLADLVRSRAVSLTDARVMVLDEADQLLGPSFVEQTESLLAACAGAGLVATTATADSGVEARLREARPGLRVHRVERAPASVQQEPGPGGSPAAETAAGTTTTTGAPRQLVILSTPDPDGVAVALAARCTRGLFFVPRRDAVDALRAAIADTGVRVAGVKGSDSPTRRSSAFSELASGAVRVLVTTDLAGRGLDIVDVGHVVHVGPPHSMDDLVHRSGRTGRGDARAGVVAAVLRPSQVDRVADQARESGMSVETVDVSRPGADDAITRVFGPELMTPAARRAPAPPARSRRPSEPPRPATSRVHRPKRKKRS